MPSLNDAFGISYLNSWSVERPVIAAANSAASEIVENGIDGFLVNQTNIQSIREALEIMATDTRLTTQMGKNGNQKLKLKYSPKKMAYDYTSVFESVT
jgi:glycosyltransferase involved in cell wall biosynthesis